MKQSNNENTIRLSVRSLVEWIHRTGDIDDRRSGPNVEDAMQIGANAHRQVQKANGPDYQSEVFLEHDFELSENIILSVDGRADGVFTGTDGVVTVDEIKTMFGLLSSLEEPIEVHLKQAQYYAYMLSERDGLPSVRVQMTYVQLEEVDEQKHVKITDDLVKRFVYDYTREEITEIISASVKEYEKWAVFEVRHKRERNASIIGMDFPYPYRAGQKEIASMVYKTVEQGEKLFVQAPTGIGKTLSMLYPAIQSVGQDLSERIFYLTAKTVTQNAPEEAMRIMEGKGLKASFTKIRAKEKMCPLTECQCDPVHCERAKGHFTRINDCLYELITNEWAITSEVILKQAEKHSVCPYELSLDASLYTDVILCDYNYAFSPHVYLQRYFADDGEKPYVFLIDEAHNLADRAREMYSAEILKSDFTDGRKAFSESKTVCSHILKASRTMLQLQRECEEMDIYEQGDLMTFYTKMTSLQDSISRFLDRERNLQNTKEKMDFYFKVMDFTNTYELLSDSYKLYGAYREDGTFYIRLFCIQPAERLSERLDQIRSTVFFSATFLPINFYKQMLTGNAEEKAIYLNSPFDPKKRGLFILRGVTTKYTRRTEAEYEKTARGILDVISARKGCYMAFFPSHRYLSDVSDALFRILGYEKAEESDDAQKELMEVSQDGQDEEKSYPVLTLTKDLDYIAQQRVMTENDRQLFLSEFRENRERTLLGFSVLGGLFSEGIDLRGERLIGVMLVGTGLPQVGPETNLIRDYYDEHEKSGFDYAYRFPGFNKCLQGAGRLIRTKEDKGVIVLMDERFSYRETKTLFPKEWADVKETNPERLKEDVSAFWNHVTTGEN